MPGAGNPLERSAALFSLEREQDLFGERVAGVSPWRLMRTVVYDEVVSLPRRGTIAVAPRRRIADALRATLRFLVLAVAGRRADLLIKTCVSGLRTRRGSEWLDVYFDPLLDAGATSYFKLVEVNSDQFEAQRRAARFEAGLDPVMFTFWGRILGTLFPAPLGAFHGRVSDLLRERLGVHLSPATLRMRVSTVLWQARLYGVLLRRLRPRAAMVSDTGEFGLSLACARAGIPFLELQHGVFDGCHPNAVPADVPGSREELLLPDGFLSRGAFWIEQLRGSRQGIGRAVPVGSPLIDEARARRGQADRRGLPLHLVVTSQGLASDDLAAWLAQAIAGVPADLEWRMSIKLHPTFDVDNDAFARLAEDPRVTLIGGADEPNVYDLLVDGDLHLSIASACHFDATAAGLPSMVLPLPGHEEIRYAVDDRSIFLAREPAEVWSLAARSRGIEVDSERFSAPHFVRNVASLLDQLGAACETTSASLSKRMEV